jgi:hypothetical protein
VTKFFTKLNANTVRLLAVYFGATYDVLKTGKGYLWLGVTTASRLAKRVESDWEL